MRPTHAMLAALLVLVPLTTLARNAPALPADATWEGTKEEGLDSASVARLFSALRASDPLVCEMATSFVGRGFSWSDGAEGIAALRDEGAEGRVTRLGLQARTSGVTALRQLVPELRSANPCLRRTAAAMLGGSGNAELLAALRDALGDGDGRVREAAALGLGVAEDSSDAPRLRAALDDRDPEVVRLAAWALGNLEDHASGPRLIALLKSANPGVRRAAAWALGRV